jgi:CarboxypepD_reg-like domain/TonB-dependent Receptor Plug Domain
MIRQKQLGLLFLLFYVLFGYTKSHAQSTAAPLFSFVCHQQTYDEALVALSAQTGVRIAFSQTFFDPKQRITKRFEHQTLEAILQSLLDKSGVGFSTTASGIALFLLPPREYTISGYITDAESGEPLAWAVISVPDQQMGTTANDFGFFSFKVRAAHSVRIQANYLGFKAQTYTISANSHQSLSIKLIPNTGLPEVVVAATKGHLKPFETPSSANLPAAWMQSVTTTVGEPDVQRHIAMLPGVVTGADGVGGLHIRGGNADQNLTLFDGMPLYNSSHAGGIFSIINPLLVKNARLIKGSMPARYGGRLSSVLDVQSREGNEHKWGAEFSLTPVSANFLVEGPIGKHGGSILVAARYSLVSPWFAKLGKDFKLSDIKPGIQISQSSRYAFQDLNARWHKRLGPKHQIYASMYKGADLLDDNLGDSTYMDSIIYLSSSRYKFNWGNTTANVRWNWVPNGQWFGNTALSFSKFRNTIGTAWETTVKTALGPDFYSEDYTFSLDFTSGIQSVTLRSDWDWLPGGHWRGKVGGGISRHDFLLFDLDGFEGENDIFEGDSTLFNAKQSDIAQEGFTYAEMEWQRKGFALNFGLHVAAFNRDKWFVVPQPRLQAAWEVRKGTALEISATHQAQFVQLLTVNDMGFPNDFWAPIAAKQRPQRAWQYSLGMSHHLTDSLAIHIEGYYKKMYRLAEFDFPSILDAFIDAGDNDDSLRVSWEPNAVFGSGQAKGIEVLLEKRAGHLTALASYTLSKSTRNHFPNRPTFRFDTRHQVVLGALWQINQHWRVSGRWQYFTGLPVNIINQTDGFFDLFFLKYFKSDPLPPNTTQIPAFHRLDLSLGWHTKSSFFEHDLSIGLHNVYNRKNVTFVVERYVDDNSTSPSTFTQRALPLLPSLRWVVKVKR